MTDQTKIVSKVLVLDTNTSCLEAIKGFCDSNGLVGLKVQPGNVMAVLRSNLDLGAILLSEITTVRSKVEQNQLVRDG